MSTGTGYALGTTTPTGWTPQQIRYYHLSMEFAGSVMQYVFLSDSGVVTSSIDIDTFVQSVVSGSPSVSQSLTSAESPPNLRVTKPCYVVVALDSAINWTFLPGSAAILTQNDLSTKYFNQNLVDGSGTVYSGQAPSSPACLIMYFSVATVSAASLNISDVFSYYFQFTQPDSSTYALVLDPLIKNKGGDPG